MEFDKFKKKIKNNIKEIDNSLYYENIQINENYIFYLGKIMNNEDKYFYLNNIIDFLKDYNMSKYIIDIREEEIDSINFLENNDKKYVINEIIMINKNVLNKNNIEEKLIKLYYKIKKKNNSFYIMFFSYN